MLRLCLFDTNANHDSSFRPPFELLSDVRVVELCPSWTVLQEHLNFGHLDAVAVNLDSLSAELRFVTIQRIAEVAPDCQIIGVSADSNPDTIIAAMRAGCGQFVRAPIASDDLRNALARARRATTSAVSMGEQIGLIGASGGAGTTTVACNLALELARVSDTRVALLDMNLQLGDVACDFDVSPKHSIADVCRDDVVIDRTLVEMAVESLQCNVSLLARPRDLGEAEEISADGVDRLCRVAIQVYPFVIVDLPRQFTQTMIAAVRACHRIFIVSQLSVPALRNATRICAGLAQAGYDEQRVELVLNRCNANHERVTPVEVEKHFGRPVYAQVPNDYRRITASRDLGHPILTVAPNSPARLAIQQFARKLAQIAPEGAGERQPGGLLGVFRRRKTARDAR